MNPESETFGVAVGAGKKVRAYKRALDAYDRESLVPLIRLLHAMLDPGELVARIHQGSLLEDFSKLRDVDRLRLLSFAERCGADACDIERMADSFEPTDIRDGSIIAATVPGVRKRLAARAHLSAGPIGGTALFSIGAACIGWTMVNRWGLRRSADIANLFTPLSLAVHRPNFVIKMIETGFEDYLDIGMLKSIVMTGGVEAVARVGGGALWNHCVGPFWSHNGFRKFDRIMGRHLENFLVQAFAQGTKFRVFLFNLTNILGDAATRDHIAAAADALASRVKGPHGVIGIDTNRRGAGAIKLVEISPRVVLIQAPPPGLNHSWAKDYNSAEGMDYEFNIVRMIEACVADWVRPSG